jgi:hypothetical protein
MVIAVLFSLASLTSADVQFIFPILDIFYSATKSIAGAAAMGSIVLTLAICATMGLFVSSSRVFWSFARDHGLPFWSTLAKVHMCLPLYTYKAMDSLLTFAGQSSHGFASLVHWHDCYHCSPAVTHQHWLRRRVE